VFTQRPDGYKQLKQLRVMPRTSVYVISLVITSYVIVTSLLPRVEGSSRKCWYGRETTWRGDDAATYKYVIPGDIQLGMCAIRGHAALRMGTYSSV